MDTKHLQMNKKQMQIQTFGIQLQEFMYLNETCLLDRSWFITKYSQTIKYLFDNVIKGKLLRIFIFDFVPDINECLQSPCVHGQCSNTLGSYTCTCEPGWTGVNCQTGKGVKTTAKSVVLDHEV